MIDFLRSIDYQLLFFFNGLHNSVLDFIMHWASNRWVWIPFYLYLFVHLRKYYSKSFLALLVIIAVTITVSDQLSSSVIKSTVMRLRPCHNPEILSQLHLVYGHCGGQYGFVSSHAANSFGLLAFLIALFKKNFPRLQVILWGWAVLVSVSRIYLAVHYPADVICGALLGGIIGIIAWYAWYLFFGKCLTD